MTEVVINPSEAQYRQFVADLEELREAGAPSNTKAIVDAVRMAAEYDQPDHINGRRAKDAPGPATGGES